MNGPWQNRNTPRPWRSIILVGLGIALIGILVFLWTSFPSALDEEDNQIDLIRLLAVLALVGAGFMHRRQRISNMLRNGAIWLAVAMVLFLGYSFRTEFAHVRERVLTELMPTKGTSGEPGKMSFRASASGHFQIDALVDGQSIRFLLDTGASEVVLSPNDARRLGFHLEELAFTGRANTANGMISTAKIRLKRLRIGSIAIEDLPAVVNGAPMSTSLLGMTFLNQLSRYGVNNGTLILEK